ncbi:MAG: trypsin-like peptidase domain-containing protein [Planctomycetes bacterium]|nr:trypsin-like peptidase domain-containing protein [Planctomycetota bacterium]
MYQSLRIAIVTASLFSSSVLAQGVLPMGQIHPNALPLAAVAQFAVPAIDRIAIETEDDARALQGLAPRYAIPNAVNIDQATDGTWEVLDAAWSLWRLRLLAPDSSHVNIGFSRFQLPPTGRLMFYSADYQNVLRPFDVSDQSASGELWLPVVNGDDMVVELYVQTAQRPQVQLTLAHIGSGYRFFGAGPHAVRDGGSGSCNIDVVCPQGAAWAQEIPSVAAISSGGSIFCTGFMINNTAQDGTPYFLTARHCSVHTNAPSLVCYWNYQRVVCGSGTGSLLQFSSGAQLRATYATSDFTLVELNAVPNAAWGVTYAGWNRSTTNATQACGIHHPSGDDKKISFENNPVTTTSYLGTSQPGDGSHVCVTDWDLGTTEPGSSGSPLFDQNHRAIGQLHGGYAACGNNSSDWYGRLSESWTGGGTNGTRLSNWLDPLATNQMTVDTMGMNVASATTYGTGCYTSYGTYFEAFANGAAFDLTGTGSTTRSIVMTPTANGYSVANGGNNWSTPTSADLGLGNDTVSSAITLPFVLSYPGGLTLRMRMCSNGYVWLGNSTGADPSPTEAELCSQLPRLAPAWTDLDPSAGGTTHYHADPGNTAVYFTWLNVPSTGAASPTCTMQVAVYASGVIEYRYRSVTNLPNGGLVGWSRGNGATVPPATDISAALPFSISVDAAGLEFNPVGRPVMGTTLLINIDNIPTGTSFAGVLLSFTSQPNGQSLAGVGMPGCFQYCSQDALIAVLTGGVSTYPFQLSLPTATVWNGMHLFTQAATLSAGVNTLGALASNGIDLFVAPN